MANDYFTLEALNAQHGDALLLHYGSKASPQVMLIDGGPMTVYKNALRPRLKELAKARGVDQLMLADVLVTHLDSDHIRGVVDLVTDIQSNSDAPADCTSFWFNTFDDAMTALPPETTALVKNVSTSMPASVDAVIASIPEGQLLRNIVRALHAKINGGGGQLLVADGAGVELPLAAGLKATLVCPDKAHLRKLAETWKKKAEPNDATTQAYLDQSVYNLSSLVIVVEAQGAARRSARMLLTGDARGDHVIAGLTNAGFMKKGKPVHFDLLKVGHHGSDRDFDAAFFTTVTATHYVISANGRDDNPSINVLEWIAQGAGAAYTVHLTNRESDKYPALKANLAAALKKRPALKKHLVFRAIAALSLKVDLLTPIPF